MNLKSWAHIPDTIPIDIRTITPRKRYLVLNSCEKQSLRLDVGVGEKDGRAARLCGTPMRAQLQPGLQRQLPKMCQGLI